MTKEERNNKLKYLITCMKCEVSGKSCDENCPTQYDAGNMGDIIKNLEEISKILEQESCKKCHNINSDYAECDQFVCSNCGIELQDWHRVERDEDDGDITYHPYEFNYCPNCGAKIDKRTLKYADQDTLMSAT